MGKNSKDIQQNNQSLTFKAVINEAEVTRNGKYICTIKGVSILPQSVKISPLDLKKNLVRKSKENNIDIKNKLYEGNYYPNILDYTLGEISHAANHVCERWMKGILESLTAESEKFQEITLTTEAIKNQLLIANPELFPLMDDLDEFCKKYEVSPNDFVESGKFNQLEINLEAISARLSSEIFFFRKKLFTELLIQKVDAKIYELKKKHVSKINVINKEVYTKWKSTQIKEIESVQKYIRSPFTFEDFDQYSNFESFETFKPHQELQQDLVSETYYWISPFPNVTNRFHRAVEIYRSNTDYRDCLDNLRLALELLLREVLGNKKSLENQTSEIGTYQNSLGISKEIKNMFYKTLDYFMKYQNGNVKHNDLVKSIDEVEFVFGLTMIFIRLIIKPNKSLTDKIKRI